MNFKWHCTLTSYLLVLRLLPQVLARKSLAPSQKLVHFVVGHTPPRVFNRTNCVSCLSSSSVHFAGGVYRAGREIPELPYVSFLFDVSFSFELKDLTGFFSSCFGVFPVGDDLIRFVRGLLGVLVDIFQNSANIRGRGNFCTHNFIVYLCNCKVKGHKVLLVRLVKGCILRGAAAYFAGKVVKSLVRLPNKSKLRGAVEKWGSNTV